ncbi:[FeFe] hydrogenase H-cluster radical SAM maturase HydE, partial [bacterium]|nr:[FeFe] hydrogenase H-cluster radical SAM maturase HydE [bacterium]
HPDDDYHERLQCLQMLFDLGYQVGSGCMIGLPGQTIDDIADDILFIKKLNLHMIGIGPYISNNDTPLANNKNGDFSIVQKFIALVRILCPKVLLPATTAMDVLRSDAREIILQSGANVVMPNITPQKYKQNYKLYPDKQYTGEDPITCRDYMEERIKKIGRKIAQDHGHSLIPIRRGTISCALNE